MSMSWYLTEPLERRVMLAVQATPSFLWHTVPNPHKIEFDFTANVQPSLSEADLHLERASPPALTSTPI
jgi:hypothetical protein